MAQKRKLVVAAAVMVVVVLLIVTLPTNMLGVAKADPLQGNSSQYPTFVVTQPVQPHAELAWDCPECAGGGGGG